MPAERTFIVSGTDTNVGKTVLAALLTLALDASHRIESRLDLDDETARTATLEIAFPTSLLGVAKAGVRFGWQRVEVEPEEDGVARVRLPPDVPFEAWLEAEGCAPRCLLGRAPAAGASKRSSHTAK